MATGDRKTNEYELRLGSYAREVDELQEQIKILERCASVENEIESGKKLRTKLYLQKTGLMQDLLTGKVRVKVDETEEVAHA